MVGERVGPSSPPSPRRRLKAVCVEVTDLDTDTEEEEDFVEVADFEEEAEGVTESER